MKNIIIILTFLTCSNNLAGQDTLVLSSQSGDLTKSYYKVKVLILENGSEIKTGRLNEVKIESEISYVGKSCKIIGSGKDGGNGGRGSDGAPADRASDAFDGGKTGKTGENGGNGASIEINFGIIQSLGSLSIDVHGGQGGKGGIGGTGGKGGDANCDNSGGQGARGGDGGTGGRGGNGGNVKITYCYSKGIKPTFNQNDKKTELITVNYSRGTSLGPGEPGSGGRGGSSKDRCGAWPAYYSRGAGRDGQAGNVGTSLGNGDEGSLKISTFDCRVPAPKTRIALVLANSEYKKESKEFPTIECPKFDYENILSSLNDAGFSNNNIIKGINLSSEKMRDKIAQFKKLIEENPNCTAFIYYSGHGFEANNGNYLAPVDVEPKLTKWRQRKNPDYRYNKILDASIELSEITNTVGYNSGMNIIVLDACRTKKYADGNFKSKFDFSNLPKETLIYFATSSGSEAWGCDEFQKSSKFTAELIKQMQVRGLELGDLIKTVNGTLNGQNPELRGNTTKSFYFNQ